MNDDIHPWLEQQGWVVKDWTGITDTDILDWIEENVEDIGTYATNEESYMVIKWSAVGPIWWCRTRSTTTTGVSRWVRA